ncbi:hypothetical protein FB451DRAFT_269082, partial [Mycena latifolia]
MEQEENPPIWPNTNEPLLVERSSSHHMFQHANRIGIDGSHFATVQGNMNIYPPMEPPPIIPRDQRPESAAILGAMATDAGNIPSSSQDTGGGVYSESGSYSSQLLRQGRGFPLYVPGPPMNLPEEYRRNGVAIGDVGRVTPEGIFDFFFNIYCAPGNGVNANTPEDFVPLPPYNPADVIPHQFMRGTHVSTLSVRESPRASLEPFPGGEFVFSCTSPNGAVLALPDGARREKLENLEPVRRYAAKHAESWYKYVNGARGRGLTNGSLYLVTGCEKTKAWGMASFQDVTPQNNFELSFKPSTDEISGYKYRWRRGTPAWQKHVQDEDPPPDDGTLLNQTPFIHAFTISLSDSLWGRLFGDVEIGELVDSQSAGRSGFVPYGSQRSPFFWAFSFFSGGGAAGGRQPAGRSDSVDVILSDASPMPEIENPSHLLNEHILQEFPEATVAITHNDDWSDALFDDGTKSTVQNEKEFLDRVLENFTITEEDGAVFLGDKLIHMGDALLSAASLNTAAVAVPPSYGVTSSGVVPSLGESPTPDDAEFLAGTSGTGMGSRHGSSAVISSAGTSPSRSSGPRPLAPSLLARVPKIAVRAVASSSNDEASVPSRRLEGSADLTPDFFDRPRMSRESAYAIEASLAPSPYSLDKDRNASPVVENNYFFLH